MRIWLVGLALTLFFIVSNYLAYNIGFGVGKRHIEKKEITVVDMANDSKIKKGTPRKTEYNISVVKNKADDLKTYIVVGYKKGEKTVKKYYKEVFDNNDTNSKEENSTIEEGKKIIVKSYAVTKETIVDTVEKGWNGIKNLYDKYTRDSNKTLK